MIFEFTEAGIVMRPEDVRDELYIEKVLDLREHEDICLAKRFDVNDVKSGKIDVVVIGNHMRIDSMKR